MVSALWRLKRRAEYLRVAETGRRFVTPGLVLQMRCVSRDRPATAEQNSIRFGITASRRVGTAVERNRVRRRLRAVAEQVLPLHSKPGCDYVLVGRAATLKRPFHALVKDLTTALKRLSAYRNPACRKDAAAREGTARS